VCSNSSTISQTAAVTPNNWTVCGGVNAATRDTACSIGDWINRIAGSEIGSTILPPAARNLEVFIRRIKRVQQNQTNWETGKRLRANWKQC